MQSLLEQVVASSDRWLAWAPAAAVVIALFALGLGISNRRTSRKALELAQQQEERRVARLEVKLINAESMRRAHERARLILLDVVVVNPTDRDGSLIEASLYAAYSTAGRAVVVEFPHLNASEHSGRPELSLDLPKSLPANDAFRGVLTFSLPDDLMKSVAVDQFKVVLRDSRGASAELFPWVMPEVDRGTTSSKEDQGGGSS